MTNCPLVAAIVVDWNRPVETMACLRSLRASCYPNLIAVLVDNGSDYSNESEYRAILPGLVYRRLVRNRGFAAGCNAGIAVARESEADYVLLLNNDAEVAPDAIGRLVNCAEEHPSFGALTATVYHRENRGRLWHAGARTLVLWPFARRITMAELKGPEPVPVDFATGCALLLRGAAIDTVGELDERFFMYSEDIDLCLRMRDAGFRIGAVPSALAWHRVAASSTETAPLGPGSGRAAVCYTSRSTPGGYPGRRRQLLHSSIWREAFLPARCGAAGVWPRQSSPDPSEAAIRPPTLIAGTTGKTPLPSDRVSNTA